MIDRDGSGRNSQLALLQGAALSAPGHDGACPSKNQPKKPCSQR